MVVLGSLDTDTCTPTLSLVDENFDPIEMNLIPSLFGEHYGFILLVPEVSLSCGDETVYFGLVLASVDSPTADDLVTWTYFAENSGDYGMLYADAHNEDFLSFIESNAPTDAGTFTSIEYMIYAYTLDSNGAVDFDNSLQVDTSFFVLF